MAEYRRKFSIYAAWNYELEAEDLNKMSKQGWQLIKRGLFLSKFKKNTEVQYRYQLDFQPNIEDRGRYIETYREQGWEYVNSTFNGWHYFRKLYDPSWPEEQYEIFTDTASVKEMNNRWAIVGMVLALILAVFFVVQAFFMIFLPNLRTLVKAIYVGFILTVLIRGIIVMKNSEKPKNAMLDKVLFVVLILWIINGADVVTKVVESSPTFDWMHISEEYAPISADLENAIEWWAFDVNYEDNYYMDVEVEASAPLCISVVSDAGQIIYTFTDDNYEKNNIRLHLKKGRYSIYFSDFAGGSIRVKASMS